VAKTAIGGDDPTEAGGSPAVGTRGEFHPARREIKQERSAQPDHILAKTQAGLVTRMSGRMLRTLSDALL
jgi:hypothetical protein